MRKCDALWLVGLMACGSGVPPSEADLAKFLATHKSDLCSLRDETLGQKPDTVRKKELCRRLGIEEALSSPGATGAGVSILMYREGSVAAGLGVFLIWMPSTEDQTLRESDQKSGGTEIYKALGGGWWVLTMKYGAPRRQ